MPGTKLVSQWLLQVFWWMRFWIRRNQPLMQHLDLRQGNLQRRKELQISQATLPQEIVPIAFSKEYIINSGC
ncbi:hypothetical protein L6164_023325 [Bauhinia variegata]|uniref:Uncharacterized protein n=1 Tax=Bauhinia variegata TaxID=167791 RepID=A0ACB9MIH4_BAUVA|nr:hypothetical protein L6164_023325 [Bauhinia variegata]